MQVDDNDIAEDDDGDDAYSRKEVMKQIKKIEYELDEMLSKDQESKVGTKTFDMNSAQSLDKEAVGINFYDEISPK